MREHYPAPPIEEAVPPTERVLLHLLEERGVSSELLFSLGNVLLRKGRVDEALKHYRQALDLDEQQPKLRVNIGVALQSLGRTEEAEQNYREALLQDSTLELALLHAGELLADKGDYEAILKLIERSQRAVSTKRLFELGAISAEKLGDIIKAKSYYRQAADLGSEISLAWLARYESAQAVTAFDEHGLLATARALHTVYKRAPEIFSREVSLRELTERVEAEKAEGAYLQTLIILSALGIVAECFEEEEALNEAEAYWGRAIEARGGSYPYGNYRRGIVYAFQGKWKRAYDELDLCRSKLPEKKQRLLKLGPLMEKISANVQNSK
jgi:tetratricopeptide (TPR) repeat protein